MVAEMGPAERSYHMAATQRVIQCECGDSRGAPDLMRVLSVSCFGLDKNLAAIVVQRHREPSGSLIFKAVSTSYRRLTRFAPTRFWFQPGVFDAQTLGRGHQPVAQTHSRIG